LELPIVVTGVKKKDRCFVRLLMGFDERPLGKVRFLVFLVVKDEEFDGFRVCGVESE
jgi:hypothetical protein